MYDPLDLGQGYSLNLDENVIHKDGKIVVYDSVVNYNNDERYILAHQTPRFFFMNDLWGYDKKLLLLKRQCYEIGECYWIIDKLRGKVLGPYTNKEYEKKAKEMKINIWLNPEYESKASR